MNQIQELQSLSPASLDAGLIFSGTATGKSVQGYASPCLFTPSQNPNYIFHDSSRDIIVWLTQDKPEPLYIYGPTGSGKTSLIKQLASKINYPVFEVTGHGRLEFADLVGHLTVKDGNMSFEYGPLSLAMLHELVQRIFNPQSEQVKYTISDANMISNYTSFQSNTKNPNPTLFLESDSQKVLSKKKFWKATVTNLGVQLHWGRMGTNGSNQVIALSDCVNNNPALEAHRRANKKIHEGYIINQTLTKLN